jgi:chromosome segregation ATPase
MTETERLVAEIPSSLKYLVDQDDRTNKEIVIAALETELGVNTEDSMAVLDRQIKRLESRLEAEKDEMDHHRNQVESIQSELDRVRSIREEKAENGGNYETMLDDVLDDLVDETTDIEHLAPFHNRIDDIREHHDRSNEEIHLDLQQRAAEQGRDLSVARFKQPLHVNDEDWRTPITERWGDGA